MFRFFLFNFVAFILSLGVFFCLLVGMQINEGFIMEETDKDVNINMK